MKVLQINSVCGVGSTGRIVWQIHEALKDAGHESYLAYGREKSPNCTDAVRIGNKLDVYYHVFLTRFFDLHGFGSKNATRKFIKWFEHTNPDIVHLHNIHGYYINIEVLSSFLKDFHKPIVWTLHDCWPITGHCAYFTFAQCEKWKTGCYRCPEKRRYPKSILLDNSAYNYKKKKELFTGLRNLTIVTPSKWLAEIVKQSSLSEYPIRVIHNGIDTDVFKPTFGEFRKKYGLNGKFIILGVANKWEERKGLQYFLELSDYLNNDEVIVLVGLSERQIRKLPKNIIGIKRTNNAKELAEIYTAADVFVNPTLEDNYPTVNLEAQACGTFVVAFDSGGTRETIINPETGMCLRVKNIESLMKAIRLVRGTMTLYKTTGLSDEEIKKISKESAIAKYMSLYHVILHGSR
ncbi:glycosyltransferase [Fervidobacterium gondwanense]|uniref:glycosyltransferase n=1 Tax=Fervidobacterium gondwanense TaxID=44754 RepID=UPI003C792E7E